MTLSIDGVVMANTTTTYNGPISMPWNSTGAAGGTRAATVSVRDAVNNTGSANRTLIVPGPASLTAAINTPLRSGTVSGRVPVGLSETNGTGTISWSLQLDGATPPIFSTSTAASTTTTSFNWDASGVTPGAHTLTLTVQDGGGRTATATRHVTVVAPPPPGLTFNTPAEGATVGGVVSVSVSATNVSGTLTWTVSVDDPRRPPNGTIVLFGGSGTATTVTFNWDTAATVADAPHTLTATVQDGAGRTATATRHVTVQQPPLTAFFTSPAEGAAVSGTVTVGMGENGAMGTPISFTLTVDGGQV